MRKIIIMTIVKIRWVYFHINPMYMKFYMTSTEPHFQHRRTGEIFSNYTWVEEESK
jgi:hypothetical protein